MLSIAGDWNTITVILEQSADICPLQHASQESWLGQIKKTVEKAKCEEKARRPMPTKPKSLPANVKAAKDGKASELRPKTP